MHYPEPDASSWISVSGEILNQWMSDRGWSKGDIRIVAAGLIHDCLREHTVAMQSEAQITRVHDLPPNFHALRAYGVLAALHTIQCPRSMKRRTHKLLFHALLSHKTEYNNSPRQQTFSGVIRAHRVRDEHMRKAISVGPWDAADAENLAWRLIQVGEEYTATLVLAHALQAVEEDTRPQLQHTFDRIVKILAEKAWGDADSHDGQRRPPKHEDDESRFHRVAASTRQQICQQSLCHLATMLYTRSFPNGWDTSRLIHHMFRLRVRKDRMWVPLLGNGLMPWEKGGQPAEVFKEEENQDREDEEEEPGMVHRAIGMHMHVVLSYLARRLPKSQLVENSYLSLVIGLLKTRPDPILAERAWRACLTRCLPPTNTNLMNTWIQHVQAHLLTTDVAERFARIVQRAAFLVKEIEESQHPKRHVTAREGNRGVFMPYSPSFKHKGPAGTEEFDDKAGGRDTVSATLDRVLGAIWRGGGDGKTAQERKRERRRMTREQPHSSS